MTKPNQQLDLLAKIEELEAQNKALLARLGELPELPRNAEGLPFSPPRLILARMRRGIDAPAMAGKLKLMKATYIGIESATVAPTWDQIAQMSMLTRFPAGFFFAEDFWLFSFDNTSLGPYSWNADNYHVRQWIR